MSYLNLDDLMNLTSDSDRPALNRMLKRFKGKLIYIQSTQLDTRERVEVLAKLVASGETVKTAKKIIMQRFGIGRKQAERIIGIYLDQKAKQAMGMSEKTGNYQ